MESGSRPDGPGLVLVCDDVESIRQLMRINLELEGFAVEEAADGHAAMARLIDPELPTPDVVVLDAQMGPKDGWWTIAAIRSHPRMTEVPVIMVTASVQVSDRVQAAEAGLDAFITKPFDPDALVEVVSRFAREGRDAPPAS
jgi:DNA-binding response OmpR family regulator